MTFSSLVRSIILTIGFLTISGTVLAQTQITAMPISGNLGERELVHPEALHLGNMQADKIQFGPADRRSCLGNCNNPGDGFRAQVGFANASLSIAQFAIQTPTESHPRGSSVSFNFTSITFDNGIPVLHGPANVGQLHVSDYTAPNGRVEFSNVSVFTERILGNGLTVRLNELELVTPDWARFHSIHIFSTDGRHAVDYSIGLLDFAIGSCTPCPTGNQCFTQGPDLFDRFIFNPSNGNYRLKLSTGQTLFGTAWRQIIAGDSRDRFVDISRGVGFQIAIGGQQINLYRNGELVMSAAPSCQ